MIHIQLAGRFWLRLTLGKFTFEVSQATMAGNCHLAASRHHTLALWDGLSELPLQSRSLWLTRPVDVGIFVRATSAMGPVGVPSGELTLFVPDATLQGLCLCDAPPGHGWQLALVRKVAYLDPKLIQHVPRVALPFFGKVYNRLSYHRRRALLFSVREGRPEYDTGQFILQQLLRVVVVGLGETRNAQGVLYAS